MQIQTPFSDADVVRKLAPFRVEAVPKMIFKKKWSEKNRAHKGCDDFGFAVRKRTFSVFKNLP